MWQRLEPGVAGMYSETKLQRLMAIFYELVQHPDGISAADLSRKLNVNLRYVHRDRKDLEAIIGSIYTEKGKWKFNPEGFLPPIRFSRQEAMTVFIAARLLLGYSNAYNPSITTAFNKISCVAPAHLRDQIRQTMEWLQKQKTDNRFCRNLEKITEAWIEIPDPG
jgi:predicted DNA-binding transcriptional regulator YafY